ncbi:MAG: glycosyltransferase family 39 protein [Tepidisphaeraceae bacterium]
MIQRRSFIVALLVALVVFVAIAPTLAWLDFSSGSENLNVATVLEMRRGGPWIVPTLRGRPRTTKPPLTAWLSASAVSPETVGALSTSDPARRADAYRSLAWQIRWPAMASSCLMLVGVYCLGNLIGGIRLGLVAMMVAGTNLLFLKFGRSNTTDVQLALWVTWTNVFFAWALLRGRKWTGFVGAGVTLGAALMSKGPVALVQTVVPVVCFVLWRVIVIEEGLSPSPRTPGEGGGEGDSGLEAPDVRNHPHPNPLPEYRERGPERLGRSLALPVFAGLVVMLLIALPWPISVLRANPNILNAWQKEVTRVGATHLEPDPFWSYVKFFPLLLPWLPAFVVGCLMALGRAPRRGAVALAMCLTFLPIVVMCFFQDKPDRYLLPMVGPASVIAAFALVEQFKPRAQRLENDRIMAAIHWATIAILAVGFPIAGATGLRTAEGTPWFSWILAVTSAAAGGGVVLAGLLVRRRWAWAVVVVPFVLMLGMQALFTHGYRQSYEGRSAVRELADTVYARAPDAAVFLHDPGAVARSYPIEIPIYFNRIVKEVSNPAAHLAPDRPTAILVPVRDDDPRFMPPEGWEWVHDLPWAKRAWKVYFAPATGK